jgi:hypothetical protein
MGGRKKSLMLESFIDQKNPEKMLMLQLMLQIWWIGGLGGEIHEQCLQSCIKSGNDMSNLNSVIRSGNNFAP